MCDLILTLYIFDIFFWYVRFLFFGYLFFVPVVFYVTDDGRRTTDGLQLFFKTGFLCPTWRTSLHCAYMPRL